MPKRRQVDAPKGQKWCAHHQAHHALAEFGPSKQHPDGLKNNCRRALSERESARYALDPQPIRDRVNEWHRGERGKASKARQRVNHPETFRRRDRLRQARYRLRKKGGGPLEIEYAEALLADPCSYCGAPATSIDHIDAVIAGGSGDWTNLTSACGSCNSRKRHRPLLMYLVA